MIRTCPQTGLAGPLPNLPKLPRLVVGCPRTTEELRQRHGSADHRCPKCALGDAVESLAGARRIDCGARVQARAVLAKSA